MRTNIVGTTWRDGDLVAIDQRQVLLGVEVLHRDHGRAQRLRSHREAQRRGVVDRRRREVDAVVGSAEQHLQHRRNAEPGVVSNGKATNGRVTPFGRPVVPDE